MRMRSDRRAQDARNVVQPEASRQGAQLRRKSNKSVGRECFSDARCSRGSPMDGIPDVGSAREGAS